jgi:hypothetical protein
MLHQNSRTTIGSNWKLSVQLNYLVKRISWNSILHCLPRTTGICVLARKPVSLKGENDGECNVQIIFMFSEACFHASVWKIKLCSSEFRHELQVALGSMACRRWVRTRGVRHVRLPYQPPGNSTFLSEQTSHRQPASSTFLSEQTSTSHQPLSNEQVGSQD